MIEIIEKEVEKRYRQALKDQIDASNGIKPELHVKAAAGKVMAFYEMREFIKTLKPEPVRVETFYQPRPTVPHRNVYESEIAE